MRLSARAQLAALPILLAAIGLSNCGGGGSSTSSTPPGTTAATPPPPVLVASATYQYDGTESVAIAYASPSATNVNSNGSYTYVANQTTSASATGAPAPFDVNRVTTYTVATAPVSGEILLAVTANTYESQTFSGATESIATAGSTTVTTGTDMNAALRQGGGPFNESSTSTTTYATPVTDAVYPLVTGATFTEPLARTVNTVTTDATAGGVYGGGGTTAITYNNDGSYTRTFSAGNGSSSQQSTVYSNGTGQLVVTTATNTTTTDVGTPAGNGGPLIPVTVTNNAGVTNDSAVDWYPGAAAPPQPLDLTTHTVVGPIALPSTCAYAGTVPPVIENTVTTANLDPLNGTYTTSTEQLYNASGTNICHAQSSTTSTYSVTTGALVSTTTTTIAEVLVASNQTILGLRRRIGH